MGVELGDRLKKFRRDANLTQDDLRVRLIEHNVILNDTAISNIETGKRKVSVDELFAFSEILGLSMSCISHGCCQTNEDWEKLTKGLTENQKQVLFVTVKHNMPLVQNVTFNQH